MEGFSYYNIFETKGIEYIAILAFFAVLIPFWIILNRRIKSRRALRLEGALTQTKLRIPQGVFFSRNHAWTHLERGGLAKVGIDDMLLHVAGPLQVQFHAAAGGTIRKGDLLAEIVSEGRRLKILSPISGSVSEPNPMLAEEPERLSEDPFRLGWLYRIQPTDWVKETSGYYLANTATVWISRELTRFKDFLMSSAAREHIGSQEVILQDGGELRDNTLAGMPERTWQEFEKDFLGTPD